MSKTEDIRVGIDIEQIYKAKNGHKVVNTFNAIAAAETFRTKRGHLAMLIKPEMLDRVMAQFNLSVSEELDGLKVLVPASIH
jgi:hypothetical protein